MKEKELREHFQGRFSDFSKKINGGQIPGIKEIREAAINKFAEIGFPENRDEEYKYTPITRSLLKNLQLEQTFGSEAEMFPPFGEYLIPELQGYLLVYWNGKLVFQSDDFPDTIEVIQLNRLDHTESPEILGYLDKLSKSKPDAFATLNTAFLNQGSVIKINADASIDRPVIIYHLSDGRQGMVYTQTRHLVIAERNSNATVVEVNKSISGDHQVFQNSVSEIFLDQFAKLKTYKLQTNCEGATMVDNTHVHQERESHITCNTFTTSGNLIRNNLNITIDGEYCESHMNGLYLVNGKNHVDNHTLVDHRIANSYSNELYKGIIEESGTGVFNGKIYVQQDAQKTNAFQSNKNILLSDKASMNTKPQLEIWADDVKCSHGATTGQLDPDQVFYLRARGLDQKQARGLLLYAFAVELLDSVSIPVLKEYLESIISNRLYQENK